VQVAAVGRPNARAFWIYLLLQVPDILLAGLILVVLYRLAGLPLWWAIGLFAAWVIKDLALYWPLRDALARPRTGPEALIGARAVAHERLAPSGLVRLGAELWRAEALHPHQPIAAGCGVVVRARRGLTLVVEAEAPAGGDGGAARRDGNRARPELPQ
jgi:membrane protein implicated in regulation of membrane protease activity